MKKLLISISLITLILMLPFSSLALGEPDYQSETLFNSDSVRLTANALIAIKDLLDQNADPVVYETLSQSLDRSNGYGVTLYKNLNSDYVIFVTNATPFNYNYFRSDRGAANFYYATFSPAFYHVNPVTHKDYIPSSIYTKKFAVCAVLSLNSNSNFTIDSNTFIKDVNMSTYFSSSDYAFTYDNMVYSNSCPIVYSVNPYPIYQNYVFMGYEDVYHTITWLNMFDDVISITNVKHGEAATPPEVEQYENFYFKGWDKDFSCVTSDMTIKTVYEFETGFRRFRITCDLDYNTLVDIQIPKDSSFLEIFTAQKCVRYDKDEEPCYIINTNVHKHGGGDIWYLEKKVIFKGFFLEQNDRRAISKYFVDFNITSDVNIIAHYEFDEPDLSDYFDEDGNFLLGKYIVDGLSNNLKDIINYLILPSKYFYQDHYNNFLTKIGEKADITSYQNFLNDLKSLDYTNKAPAININLFGAECNILDLSILDDPAVRPVYDSALYAITFIWIFSFIIDKILKYLV